MTEVTIRPLKREDKEIYYKLWCDPDESYIKFYNLLDKMNRDIFDYNFERYFDDSVHMWSCVAEHEGEVIGFCNYLTHLNTWTKEDSLYLNDLYVLPSSRLGGVGRKLIEYVYTQADKLGAPKVYWQTAYNNHRAQLLYTKVGVRSDKVVYLRP